MFKALLVFAIISIIYYFWINRRPPTGGSGVDPSNTIYPNQTTDLLMG